MLVSAASVSGFAGGEIVTLSLATPGGTLAWRLTRPGGSVAVLSSTTAAEPTFTPDSVGTYTASVTVNGITSYSLAIGVTSASSPAEVRSRYLLLESPDTVPTPAAGNVIIRWDDETERLLLRDSDGAEAAITGSAVPSIVTLPTTADAGVSSPATGVKVYYSTERDALVQRFPDGTTAPVGPESPIETVAYTDAPIAIPAGASYTEIISYPIPTSSLGMQSLGCRLQVWEEQSVGNELAIRDEILIAVRRFGATVTLTNTEDGTSGSSLTGTFTSGVAWRVTVSSSLVRFEVGQHATNPRRAHARVWADEELSTDWT
jgi:hypothetical protein